MKCLCQRRFQRNRITSLSIMLLTKIQKWCELIVLFILGHEHQNTLVMHSRMLT